MKYEAVHYSENGKRSRCGVDLKSKHQSTDLIADIVAREGSRCKRCWALLCGDERRQSAHGAMTNNGELP